jgi:hypothetical protein
MDKIEKVKGIFQALLLLTAQNCQKILRRVKRSRQKLHRYTYVANYAAL